MRTMHARDEAIPGLEEIRTSPVMGSDQEKTSKFAVTATKIRLEERDKQGTFVKDVGVLAERAKTSK